MIHMSKNIKYTILFFSLLSLFPADLFSQEETVISPYVSLKYFKNTDDHRTLQTTLTYSDNRVEMPIPGMAISYYSGIDVRELIGTVLTDDQGVAKLELSNELEIKPDPDGMWNFTAECKGNDTIEAATSEVAVKDVRLELLLSEIDSIKTITVNAFVTENGKEIPVTDENVLISVPRMFSSLPVGDVNLDETGTASIEFPSDLPGDKDGNITISARFEENYTFGNVEKKETLKWGIPTDYFIPSSHRALWTKTAPKWMIYTLSVLLTGVWGHYLFAIISLFRIKRDADKNKV